MEIEKEIARPSSAPGLEAVKGRKELVGQVVSNKMVKTVVVRVPRLVKHPMYKRYVSRSTKLKAHDEKQLCQVGDFVRVRETRPLSKEKCWRVVEILKTTQTQAKV